MKRLAIPDDLADVRHATRVHLAAESGVVASNEDAHLGRGARLLQVSLASLTSNPRQPRTTYCEEALESLAASIEEHGLLHPPIVRRTADGFEIVAGERRVRACKRLADRGLLASRSIPVLVRDDVTDSMMSLLAWVENEGRVELSLIERAEALGTIVDARAVELGRKPSVRELADIVRPNRTVVHELLTIYGSLRDRRTGPLVRAADSLDKSLLLKILRVEDIERRTQVLGAAAGGSEPAVLRAMLSEGRRKSPGRPTDSVTRRRHASGGYDATIRIRPGLTSAQRTRILAELDAIRSDVGEAFASEAGHIPASNLAPP